MVNCQNELKTSEGRLQADTGEKNYRAPVREERNCPEQSGMQGEGQGKGRLGQRNCRPRSHSSLEEEWERTCPFQDNKDKMNHLHTFQTDIFWTEI